MLPTVDHLINQVLEGNSPSRVIGSICEAVIQFKTLADAQEYLRREGVRLTSTSSGGQYTAYLNKGNASFYGKGKDLLSAVISAINDYESAKNRSS